jgi:RNA polymerase sigma factor (sigma-70 family)
MESLFLLAFSEEEFLTALAIASSEAFFNKLLVVKIAKRYRNQGLGLLDRFQEGNIGLIQAVKQFNYTRGYKFSTCAIFWIRRAIRYSLHDL